MLSPTAYLGKEYGRGIFPFLFSPENAMSLKNNNIQVSVFKRTANPIYIMLQWPSYMFPSENGLSYNLIIKITSFVIVRQDFNSLMNRYYIYCMFFIQIC